MKLKGKTEKRKKEENNSVELHNRNLTVPFNSYVGVLGSAVLHGQ